MKKFLFAAIALFVFGMANAQQAGPSSPVVSDHSTILSKVQLDNIIYMVPSVDLMATHFSTVGDYLDPAGLVLQDLWGNNTSPFLVFSNRNFNVTIKSGASNFSYIGPGTGNNVMPCGVLSYNLFSNATGGANSTPSTWNALSTADAPLITGGTYGPARPFSIKLKATPGWNYTGGTYMIDVILTATQQ